MYDFCSADYHCRICLGLWMVSGEYVEALADVLSMLWNQLWNQYGSNYGKGTAGKPENGGSIAQTEAGDSGIIIYKNDYFVLGGEKMKYRIECMELTKSFQEKEVLKGLNLKVEQGEIIGLLGPSGAGKTTLIKILTGQLRQTSGIARLSGKDTDKLDYEIYKKMGMMLDNLGLYERLTVYDNLMLFARLYELPKNKIDDVLHHVGLWEGRKYAVSKLSKGMRGRLALARAVLHEPDILFLDEPTTGLDPSTAEEIHGLIRKEQERGATVFLTTHNMAEAEKLCQHVALLHEGAIVEYGVPEEICRRYNHQNKLRIHLHNGTDVELANDRTAGEAVRNYLEAEELETIHTSEPNLETVFMELTGRGLE